MQTRTRDEIPLTTLHSIGDGCIKIMPERTEKSKPTGHNSRARSAHTHKLAVAYYEDNGAHF